MYVKDFFFVNVLFFNFSLFIPRPSTGVSDLFYAIRFKLCTFSIMFSSVKTVDVFTYDKDVKISRYCAKKGHVLTI